VVPVIFLLVEKRLTAGMLSRIHSLEGSTLSHITRPLLTACHKKKKKRKEKKRKKFPRK